METLGRYELRGALGQGGFAVVYRAWDPALQREVALKVLLPRLTDDPEIRQRFLAEARRIAGLRHPNIVTVHDVGEADGRPFFTMELIDGQSLADLIAGGGPLPLPQVAGWLGSLAAAVDYIHAAGLIHRDIKAANVMVERSGRVVLMDFGIARALEGTSFTRASVIMGTPEAMAPEQIRGEPVGQAADVYALGVLTYQLLAGRPPFSGELTRVLFAHAYEPPPPLRDLRPDLPEPVYRAVEAALAKSPRERPPTAGAFATALVVPDSRAARVTAAPPPTTRPAPVAPTVPFATADAAWERAGTDAAATRPAGPPPPRPVTPPAGMSALPPAAPPAGPPAGRNRLALPLVLGGAALAVVIGVVLVTARGGGDSRIRDRLAGSPAATTPTGGTAAADPNTLVAGGPALSVRIAGPKQKVQVGFEGKAGQRLSLAFTRVTIGSSGCCSADVAVLDPDGKSFATTSFGTDGGVLDLRPLPEDGRYSITITAQKDATGSAVLTLSPEATGTLVANGQPTTITLDRPGQRGRFTFEGKAGQRVSMRLTRVRVGSSGCCSLEITLLDPDGKRITSGAAGTDGAVFDAVTLPAAGTYTVFVAPQGTVTGSLMLTLYDVPPDTATITVGGPAVTVTTTIPGHNPRVTFEGKAGQRVSLAFTRVNIGGSGCCAAEVAVLDPDGKTLASGSVGTDGGVFDAFALPSAGTYVIRIDPQGENTGSLTLTLYEIPPDPGAITVDGPPVQVTVAVPGQNPRLTFEGQAGQRLSLGFTRVAVGGSGCCGVEVAVLDPDGKTLAGGSFGTDSGSLNLRPLPLRGTYVVVINPVGTATGSLTVTLSQEVPGTLSVGGPPVALTIERPGQNARLTFEGRAGQSLTLTAARVTIGGSGCCGVEVTVLDPNAKTIASGSVGTDGGGIKLPALPAAGTYTVTLNPQAAATGAITLTLREGP
jgi:predicted Ser/Thr protein kinase